MVSQVSFGQLNTINGKTVLTGSQSGIDTNALINELATAKAMPATVDQTKITANQAKITAYTSLKTALSTLETSLDALRNPTANSSATNAFGDRTPFLSVDNGGTASNYVGVATNNGAPIGNYVMQVTQLAAAETDQSSSFTDTTSSVVNAASTNTAGAFAAGTFQINGVNITLSQGDSLSDVEAAINSESSNTNVTASILEVSPTDYQLQLAGTQTGAANAITITDTNGVLPSAGAVMGVTYKTTTNGSSQTMFTVSQPAQNAEIQFGTTTANMQTITRSSNQISDLLENTTISLYGVTAGATVSLAIDKDDDSIATAVNNFVTAYNAIRTFNAQQTQINPTTGAPVTTAVLDGDSTMNTVINELSTLISGQASIAIPSQYSTGVATTAPVRMGDVGITLDNVAAGTDANGNATPAVTNTLDLDTNALETNLESYFDNVSNIFQFNFTASSPSLAIYQRDNTVTNATFSIAVNSSAPSGSQAMLTAIDGSTLATPVALTYTTDSSGNVVISGPSDTELSGLSFNYTGDGDETIQEPNPMTAKDFTLAIGTPVTSGTPPVTTNTANVTQIFGQTLTTPIAMQYSDEGISASIDGEAGTAFSGLQMVYTGSGNETINVAMSQGIADQLYNAVDGIVNGVNGASGIIDSEINTLTASDTKLQTDITNINNQVSDYRNQLLTTYSQMEAAISSANSLLSLLSAQSDAALVESGNSNG